MTMMSSAVPRYAVSEDALRLILHAANEIALTPRDTQAHGRMVTSSFGRSVAPTQWRPETALLRLVAIVEAYIDVVSMKRMSRVIDASHSLVQMLITDFKVASTANWNERHGAFERYHELNLRTLPTWQLVAAGIEVRNCFSHGLGKLTARQRTKTSLAAQIGKLDVVVASNQMYLAESSVPKLAPACADLVRAIDAKIVIPTGY